jgi:ankyrin repeat protein
MTALHIASKNGNFDIVLKILFSGAIIDAKDIVNFNLLL